jgi:hypothetical protein
MHYERHHRKGRGIESRPRSPQTLHWHKSRVTWGAILANPTQPPPFLFRCEFLGRHRCPHKQIQSRRSKERKQVVLADLSLGVCVVAAALGLHAESREQLQIASKDTFVPRNEKLVCCPICTQIKEGRQGRKVTCSSVSSTNILRLVFFLVKYSITRNGIQCCVC